jgi:2-polyprenyl-3-methyl-5-hydroxy-6-metoxy-1,4-benzoquinol methylase
LGWFSLRYSAEGLENLYKKYRGESYTAVRNKWESWYDGKYNESHQNTDWINSRAKAISTFLKGKVDLSVSEVVDIGGDTGQIAELLGAKSFRVVEISDRAVSSKTQSRHLPSVAVLAHVLEHVSSPKEFLASLLKNHNSVYVEVPNGIPSITPERRSTARLVLGLLASLSPHTWRPFARPSAGRRHPAQLLRVSEHLTFFNEVSFQNLPAGDIEGSLLVSSISAEIPSPDRTDPVKVLQALWKSNM